MSGESVWDRSAELKKAQELLESEGFAVTKRAGQSIIQIVRIRQSTEDPRWVYRINKYEKHYYAEGDEEIQTITLELSKIEWKNSDRIPPSEPKRSKS